MEIKTDWALQVCEVMRKTYSLGLTDASGGNLSVKDEKGNVWITPSGGDKSKYLPKDILQITKKGEVIGTGSPSMEAGIHRGIYDLKPWAKAIVHAHSSNLVANSFFRERTRVCELLPLLEEDVHGIEKAAYAPPGSTELRAAVIEALSVSEKTNIAILNNHGAFAISDKDLAHALKIFHKVEHSLGIEGRAVGAVGDEPLLSYPPRSRVEEFWNKCGKRLMFAEPRGEVLKSFREIESRGINRRLFTPGDLGISIRTKSTGVVAWGDRFPSALYEKIYETSDNINAIIIGNPLNAMVFAVTHREFEMDTIPESHMVLKQQVEKFPFGTDALEPEEVAEYFKKGGTVAILENQYCVAVGASLFEAYDRMEVFEMCSEALMTAGQYGRKIHSIKDEAGSATI